MVDYGKMYINVTENSRKVWWKLFNNSNINRWVNILMYSSRIVIYHSNF